MKRRRWFATAGMALITSAASASGDDRGMSRQPFNTLDGQPPLVIGHRGLPGLFPEETRPSYEHAAEAGADSLEMDLHLTKDCLLVARHNPWLSDNTSIAEVAAAHPDLLARKRTRPGRRVDVGDDASRSGGPAQLLTDLIDPGDPRSVLGALIVDGEDHTGDWAISDFTLAEAKRWLRGTTYDAAAERPSRDNGRDPVLSFQEIIDIAKARSRATGRTISVYPETKNPVWNNAQAIANGCDLAGTGHPFEDALLKIVEVNGLNAKEAPIFMQSFDPASLAYLRRIGLKTRVVQLVGGNAVDYRTGTVIYVTNDARTFTEGRPFSWTLAGDPRDFGHMLTPAGLAKIKTYADGIGVWKPQVMALKIAPFPTRSEGGSPFTGALADVTRIEPTPLIAEAHAAGLFVHAYTFRNEAKYLAGVYRGDPMAEYLPFFRAGIDGVFTDFAHTGVAARAAYLKELGR